MYKVFKWIADRICSFLGLVILAPIFIIIALAIKLTSKGPVFFKQKRVGKNKKLFTIHKFRTMYIETPKDMPTHLLENPDAFITKIGGILRKTSLDELPQIWDIFRGKMSVVGPRPALYNQDDLIIERDKYSANSIRPGLTGLAQISGRDELDIPLKAKIDGEYFKKMGLILDAKIFFKTILNVIKKDGIQEGRHADAVENTAENTETADIDLEIDKNVDDNQTNIDSVEKESE